MANPSRIRVYGPVLHRNKWRVELREGRNRSYRSFASEEEAAKFAAKATSVAMRFDETVDHVIELYDMAMRKRMEKGEVRKGTVETTITRLRQFFKPMLSSTIDDITPSRANYLYKQVQDRWSVDTHRNTLAQVKTFWRWCQEEKLAQRSPWAEVRPVGKRRRGKPQLRVDEARKLTAYCLKVLEDDEAALPTLILIYMATRATETMQLASRDVDDCGSLLWIAESKTECGRRTIEVPGALAPLLHEKAMDAEGGLLWPDKSRYWLRWHVKRLCREAGVPEVGPHSLRGLHATLAREAGATSHAVARTLGHSSPTVTQAHYEAPGTTERVARKRATLRLVHK